MKKKKELNRLLCIIIAMFASYVIHAQAQNAITHERNGIRLGDRVEKQQVEYVNPGESGENTVWDFSDASAIKSHPTVFFCDSDSIEIIELQPAVINKYALRTDSLLCTGYETPLKSVRYSQPIPLAAYPMQYGDALTLPYSGSGYYCKTHAIQTLGMMDVEADGTGILILSESDTLRNVLRVHSIRTGSIDMHLDVDSTALEELDAAEELCSAEELDAMEEPDSVAKSYVKQEIEERYLWYARGYRYPLFETVTTSYYDNMQLVSCLQSAYRYAPDMQHLLKDEANEAIQQADSIAEQQNAPDIIRYSIAVNGGIVKIAYSLSDAASVTALICNHRGMAYRRATSSLPAGEGYEISFNCSGLEPDVYIIYINVNGKVYSEKIILK